MPVANWQCPNWMREALAVLRPPNSMSVSEWAEANLVLSSAESSKPGPYKVNHTEYLREIMDSFTDPEVEEIIVVKPTQVGGTRGMLNMIGASLDVDPAPMMVVYPKDTSCEKMAQGRIKPMLETTESLRVKYDSNSKLLDMQFTGGITLTIAGANSPASLASHHIRYLFLDEEEKFPLHSGKEASPAALAMERTKTYRDTRKIVRMSTPVYEDGPIWRSWLEADTQRMCYVACPHCGARWIFDFKQLKFNVKDEEDARKNAVYVCEECGGVINDRQKDKMVKRCAWRTVRTNGSRRRIAYWFNTFYSPYVTLGDIAGEFVRSRNYPELLQNFINSWLAEPYKQVEAQHSAEYILNKRQSSYVMNEVPPNTVLITGGVDVQRKSFYWTVRAWRADMTSFNVAHGQAYSWEEIKVTMNREYLDAGGGAHMVNLTAIDSGDQTDEVYMFCLVNREWAIPVKGASAQIDGKMQLKRIEKEGASKGMLMARVDTKYYKDMISARMAADEENGGWYVYEGCDPEYAEQITAEQKVIERVGRHLVSRWKEKQGSRGNHYWDCEVYAAVAADLVGLRRMAAQAAQLADAGIPMAIGQRTAQPVVDARPRAGGYFSNRRRYR